MIDPTLQTFQLLLRVHHQFVFYLERTCFQVHSDPYEKSEYSGNSIVKGQRWCISLSNNIR